MTKEKLLATHDIKLLEQVSYIEDNMPYAPFNAKVDMIWGNCAKDNPTSYLNVENALRDYQHFMEV